MTSGMDPVYMDAGGPLLDCWRASCRTGYRSMAMVQIHCGRCDRGVAMPLVQGNDPLRLRMWMLEHCTCHDGSALAEWGAICLLKWLCKGIPEEVAAAEQRAQWEEDSRWRAERDRLLAERVKEERLREARRIKSPEEYRLREWQRRRDEEFSANLRDIYERRRAGPLYGTKAEIYRHFQTYGG